MGGLFLGGLSGSLFGCFARGFLGDDTGSLLLGGFMGGLFGSFARG